MWKLVIDLKRAPPPPPPHVKYTISSAKKIIADVFDNA